MNGYHHYCWVEHFMELREKCASGKWNNLYMLSRNINRHSMIKCHQTVF